MGEWGASRQGRGGNDGKEGDLKPGPCQENSEKQVCVCLLITQSVSTLCDPMYCSPSGSSVRGILEARILEWGVIPFSRGLPNQERGPQRSPVYAVRGDTTPSQPPHKHLQMNYPVSTIPRVWFGSLLCVSEVIAPTHLSSSKKSGHPCYSRLHSLVVVGSVRVLGALSRHRSLPSAERTFFGQILGTQGISMETEQLQRLGSQTHSRRCTLGTTLSPHQAPRLSLTQESRLSGGSPWPPVGAWGKERSWHLWILS